MFADPDGRLVGLYKRADGPEQKPSAGEGAAIDWFEVLGSDGDRTWAFYSELFGWKANGSGPYWLVDTGGGRGINGGVGAGGGSKWATVYAHVPDVEKTFARAEQLGGKREYGPNQIDDHMRTGAIRDPAGNVVGIYEHKH
jgi:predicted enzyme related to lactoylglutathione lyase